MKRETTRPELLTAGEATLALGRFSASLRYTDLPPEVTAKVKECVLDALGCCLFGVTRPWTRMVLDMVLEQGGAPQASIMGTPHRTSASQAVLVTSTAGHGFELDDIHVQAHLHPGSLTVPVALALGEWRGPVSGKDFITAVAAGYEVALRVGLAATAATSCAATTSRAPAARSRRGNGRATAQARAEQARHALGIAGSQAAGLMAAQEGAMAKRCTAAGRAERRLRRAAGGARLHRHSQRAGGAYGGFLSAFTDTAQPGI